MQPQEYQTYGYRTNTHIWFLEINFPVTDKCVTMQVQGFGARKALASTLSLLQSQCGHKIVSERGWCEGTIPLRFWEISQPYLYRGWHIMPTTLPPAPGILRPSYGPELQPHESCKTHGWSHEPLTRISTYKGLDGIYILDHQVCCSATRGSKD